MDLKLELAGLDDLEMAGSMNAANAETDWDHMDVTVRNRERAISYPDE